METPPMLQRLARACFRRRRYVLVAWILVLVSVLSRTAGGKDATNFSLPGTESQRAFDLLKANFPAQAGDSGDVVFEATGPGGGRNPAIEQRMTAALAAAEKYDPHVLSVTSPYGAQAARRISPNGQIAFGTIQFDQTFNDLPKGTASAV